MKHTGKAFLPDGTCLLEHISVADTFWTRFLGLMGRRGLKPSEGMLLVNTGSIHTCFMRFPIQVVYLDADFKVLCVETVAPWRLGSMVRHTKYVLELSMDRKLDLAEGARLQFDFLGRRSVPSRKEGDSL